MASPAVVGGAVVHTARVLATRRADAPAGTGWEFPGGKVELGESESQALARELLEELSLQVRVGQLLGRTRLPDSGELAVYVAKPLRSGPRLGRDHDQLRWLGVGDLHSVAWLDADRVFLNKIAELLGAH